MGFVASVRAQLERKLFGRTDFTAPAIVYAAGFVGASEAASNGYARVAMNNDTTSFPAASPLVNGIDILFPVATGAGYGAIDSIRFYDAASAGNEIGRSTAFAAININAAGKRLRIAAGSLTISVT
jgi:hypothetical protein